MASASFYFRWCFLILEKCAYLRHKLFISRPFITPLFPLSPLFCLMRCVAWRGVALITSLAETAGQCQRRVSDQTYLFNLQITNSSIILCARSFAVALWLTSFKLLLGSPLSSLLTSLHRLWLTFDFSADELGDDESDKFIVFAKTTTKTRTRRSKKDSHSPAHNKHALSSKGLRTHTETISNTRKGGDSGAGLWRTHFVRNLFCLPYISEPHLDQRLLQLLSLCWPGQDLFYM